MHQLYALSFFRKLRDSVQCNWIYLEHLSCTSAETGGPIRFSYTFCNISIRFGFACVWILFAFAKCQIPLSVLYFETTVVTEIIRYFYMILPANLMVSINIFSGIGYLAVLMVLCVRYSLSWFMARPVSPYLTLWQ